MIAVTLRGLMQRRLRTILTAMAVVLGVAMVSAAFTVSATMRSGADSLSAAAYDGTDAVLGAPSTVKTLGKATVAIFDLATAQSVVGQAGKLDDVLVKGKPGVDPVALRARLAAALGPQVKVQAAAAHDRFTLDGLKQFISIIKVVL